MRTRDTIFSPVNWETSKRTPRTKRTVGMTIFKVNAEERARTLRGTMTGKDPETHGNKGDDGNDTDRKDLDNDRVVTEMRREDAQYSEIHSICHKIYQNESYDRGFS